MKRIGRKAKAVIALNQIAVIWFAVKWAGNEFFGLPLSISITTIALVLFALIIFEVIIKPWFDRSVRPVGHVVFYYHEGEHHYLLTPVLLYWLSPEQLLESRGVKDGRVTGIHTVLDEEEAKMWKRNNIVN